MDFLSSILAEAKGVHNSPSSQKPADTSSNILNHIRNKPKIGTSTATIATSRTTTTQAANPTAAHPSVAAQRNASTAMGRTAAVSHRYCTDSQAVDRSRSARPMAKMRTGRFSLSSQLASVTSKDTSPSEKSLPTRSTSTKHYSNRPSSSARALWTSSARLDNKDSSGDWPLPEQRTSPSPSPIYQLPSSEHEPTLSNPTDSESPHHSKSTDLFNIPPTVEEGLIMAVHKLERRPARLQKGLYVSMTRRQLLEEAKFRSLELVHDNKDYIIEVLVVNDEAYFELMQKLGDRYLAEEFSQGAVKQYHRDLKLKGAVGKPAIIKKAAKVKDVSAKRKRESSQYNDSDNSTAPLLKEDGDVEEQVKPKKRSRSISNGKETTRRKKAKFSPVKKGPHPHVEAPKIVQDDSDSFHTDYTSEMDSEISDDKLHAPTKQHSRSVENEPSPSSNDPTLNEDVGIFVSDKRPKKGAEIQKPVYKPASGERHVRKEVKPGVAIAKNGPRKQRSAASTAVARDRMNVKRFLKF